MAESTLSLDYDDIQIEVGRFLGYDVDPDNWTNAQVAEVDRYIQTGYRQFLYPPAVEGVETGYEWSFLKPTTTITTIARYATGSIVVASGTCTLTGGVWPAWTATHGTFVVDGTTYTITTRDSDTELTVVGDDATEAEGDWYLRRSCNQDLPDSFGHISGDLHFEESECSIPIIVVSEHKIQTLLQQTIDESRPQYAAIRFKSSDGSDGQRQEICWHPIPDDAYTITYRYEAYTGKLTTLLPYPLGGMKHSEVIMESCLAVAEQRMNDAKDLHWDSFVRLLATAVAQDRKNGARYYGQMGYSELGQKTVRHRRTGSHYPITYDGETW